MQHGTIIRTHTGRPIADLSTGELQLKRLVDHIPTAVFFIHGFVESFKHSCLKLQKRFMCDYDEAGSIGKRYRREDEIGTPYCITVDFDTVGDAEKAGDNCVTVRERDTMEQVRVPISELKAYLAEKLAY